MGKSYKPVMFVDDDLQIDAHSATAAEDLGPLKLKDFAQAAPVRVSECDNGDFLFELGQRGLDYVFAEGPPL